MQDPGIATAADYADAMMTARRAKNAMVLLLVLVLLAQLTVFFLARYNVISVNTIPPASDTSAATTQPAGAVNWADVYHYITGTCLFVGVSLPIVLSFVLLLIVNIMLVGRLIGVARLTSAYIWCLILLVLMFPWQAFLSQVGLTPAQAPWKWPGALYTWYEFIHPTQGAKFPSSPINAYSILKWWRYVGMPVISLIILLVIQVKSNRGMRQALGEEDVNIPAGETTADSNL